MSEELRVAPTPELAAVVEACKSAVETPAPVAERETGARSPELVWSPTPEGEPEETILRSTEAFAARVHRYVNGCIRLADRNAAFLFAAVGATLAFLNARGATKLWIKSPFDWSLSETLAFLAVMGFLASATASAVVLLPRKKGSRTGLVFWGAISKCRSAEEYARLVVGQQPTGLAEATLEHCFELSRVCTSKYRAMSWALWSGGAGFVGTLLYLALT